MGRPERYGREHDLNLRRRKPIWFGFRAKDSSRQKDILLLMIAPGKIAAGDMTWRVARLGSGRAESVADAVAGLVAGSRAVQLNRRK